MKIWFVVSRTPAPFKAGMNWCRKLKFLSKSLFTIRMQQFYYKHGLTENRKNPEKGAG